MTPRQFMALLKRHEAHINPGAKPRPKPTGMGPEVYAAFARAAEEYGASD